MIHSFHNAVELNVFEVFEDFNLLARSDFGKAVGFTLQRYIIFLKYLTFWINFFLH